MYCIIKLLVSGEVLVRTRFESHWGLISVAVLAAYLAMLSLRLACRGHAAMDMSTIHIGWVLTVYSWNCLISPGWLASIAEGDSIINATLLYYHLYNISIQSKFICIYLHNCFTRISSRFSELLAVSHTYCKDQYFIWFKFVLESQLVECSMESFMHKDYRS